MLLIKLLSAIVIGGSVANAGQITLYTDRPTARLQNIASDFKAQTGNEVVIVELPFKDLFAKLKSEGSTSPADIIFTKDMVFLAELSKGGFFRPLNSEIVSTRVASQMRSVDWTAITYRVRTLVYDKEKADVSLINSYSDLTKPEWAGRLCLRTSQNSYNEALVSAWITQYGYDDAKTLTKGLVQNLALGPHKGDTALLEAIANGECEVGIANHYYLAQILALKPNFPVGIKFLEQSGSGVHVNGSGAGIAQSSKSPELAQKFIELLLEDKHQIEISAGHFEYPAAAHLAPTSLIQQWGGFKYNSLKWSDISNNIDRARQLVKEVDYK